MGLSLVLAVVVGLAVPASADDGTWSSASSLATARSYHTATLLPSGKVLVAGGYAGGVSLASAELYDPVTDGWSSAGSLSSTRRERHSHAARERQGPGGGRKRGLEPTGLRPSSTIPQRTHGRRRGDMTATRSGHTATTSCRAARSWSWEESTESDLCPPLSCTTPSRAPGPRRARWPDRHVRTRRPPCSVMGTS